jgi:hypothetical protein
MSGKKGKSTGGLVGRGVSYAARPRVIPSRKRLLLKSKTSSAKAAGMKGSAAHTIVNSNVKSLPSLAPRWVKVLDQDARSSSVVGKYEGNWDSVPYSTPHIPLHMMVTTTFGTFILLVV